MHSQGCGQKGTQKLEGKLVKPLRETVWKFFKNKKKLVLSYDPEIPPLGIYPKELKSRS